MEESLKLSNQLCFPLYVCSKEIVRKYKPFLDEFDLTYTQYIVLLSLWEKDNMTVKEIGEKVYLDSGTLTPLLNKLMKKKLINKKKGKDGRETYISLAEEGHNLEKKIVTVPQGMAKCVHLSQEEVVVLYKTLYKIINEVTKDE